MVSVIVYETTVTVKADFVPEKENYEHVEMVNVSVKDANENLNVDHAIAIMDIEHLGTAYATVKVVFVSVSTEDVHVKMEKIVHHSID